MLRPASDHGEDHAPQACWHVSHSDIMSSPPDESRRPTGDPAVDEVLGQLDAVTDEPLDTQIEVGERVHQVLQGRLVDLGQE